jgi:flagellar basal-body rod protein FlgB
MHLFDLAMRHRAWLAQGQTVVAENVANINTPGYKARRVVDFSEALAGAAGVTPVVTHRSHISPVAMSRFDAAEIESSQASTHSGNTVNLDAELLKAGEIRSGYALNASVVKAFHRMLQQSVRG